VGLESPKFAKTRRFSIQSPDFITDNAIFEEGTMPNTRRAFIRTGFFGLGAIFAGCGTTQPNYGNPKKFTNNAGNAVQAGREFVRKNGVLPPIPFGVYEAQEHMLGGRTDIGSQVFKAIGTNWAEGILDVNGKNRTELLAAAVAMMDGAIDEIRTINPREYKRALQLRDQYCERALRSYPGYSAPARPSNPSSGWLYRMRRTTDPLHGFPERNR
jgi:hypothetical protein